MKFEEDITNDALVDALEEIQRLRSVLDAIRKEALMHTEHNPISGKDRLPAGYAEIVRVIEQFTQS